MSGPHATNANMKPLRKGWEWMPLGKYVENHDGRRIPISKRERESRSGLFPYYGASGVIDTIDGFTHDGEFLLIGEDGANLLTRSKPLAFLTKGKVWVNNHAHVLRCKPGYSNAYLAYFINSIDLSEYVTGTAQPKLSQSMMNKILIPVAPPEQQVEIVAELEKQFSRLDEAVANLQRVKANLKRYKASVFKDAVEGRLVPTEAELARREGRSFETGEQLLQRILETRHSNWAGRGKFKTPDTPETMGLVELPSGWVWASVAQLADVISGLTKNPSRETLPLKLPYLRVANVYANELRLDDMAEIGVADNELQKLLVLKNDLLVVEGNGSPDQIGRVAKWDGSIALCVHQNHLIKVRAIVAEPDWMLNWLISPGGRKQIERVSSSTTGLHTLSSGKVGRLPIPLPPVTEQKRIVLEVDRRLSLIRGVESEVDTNLKRAQALRQSTLGKAFSLPPIPLQ